MSTSQLVFIAGLAGAGKTTAAEALEDAGYYRVDNMPVLLLPDLLRHLQERQVERICVVLGSQPDIDLMAIARLGSLPGAERLDVRRIFLQATAEEIQRRFTVTRRAHPFRGTLEEALKQDIHQAESLVEHFDICIDTTDLNVHQLRARVLEICTGRPTQPLLHLQFVSFGFSYGIYRGADLVQDVRFLPNPHFDPELRPLTGMDDRVFQAVVERVETREFLDCLLPLLEHVFQASWREGKTYLTCAFGCTGGRHRSVSLARLLAQRYSDMENYHVSVYHRDRLLQEG
ncbi:MAG: RNase adapter RapZ [Desulfurivibrio sp.]|nr:RNase adapter RapZ [Desulfurivibrio sp.]